MPTGWRLSGFRHKYDDVRGKGFFAQTRRERRSIPAAGCDGASNEVWAKKTCRPPGCAQFGLWLRCSSVTAPLPGDAPSSRLATGQIGRNERHRIYASDHLALARELVAAAPRELRCYFNFSRVCLITWKFG